MGESYTFPLTFDGSTRKKKNAKMQKNGGKRGSFGGFVGKFGEK